MENSEKSFETCHDKDCEAYAQVLMTLISDNEKICNIKRTLKEFNKDNNVVSNEYVLSIGEKSSAISCENFGANIYDSYGIQIGTHGHKAWISCKEFPWDEENYSLFTLEYYDLLKGLQMAPKISTAELKILRKVKKRILESKKSNKDFEDKASFSWKKDKWEIPILVVYYVISAIEQIKKRRKKADMRDRQYKFAIAWFFQNHLEAFLKMQAKPQEENDL